MKIRIFRDLAGIFLIYALYAVLTVWLYDMDLSAWQPADIWPIDMLAGSLLGMLLWYVLGEWVIRPHASATTWYGTWFALLALILGWACFVFIMESQDTSANPNPWLHFLGGAGFFYLASVLFSPLFAKYLIWPAVIVRKW